MLFRSYYAEYRTDDARLTIEVLKTAVKNKAVALNYAEVSGFLYNDKTVNGISVLDKNTQESFNIKSKFVINAAGPWVDDVRLIDKPKTRKRLHLAKGVHLVFNIKNYPLNKLFILMFPMAV